MPSRFHRAAADKAAADKAAADKAAAEKRAAAKAQEDAARSLRLQECSKAQRAAAKAVAAAKAAKEAEDAEIAAAIAASLAISGPVTPPPPPLTLAKSLATSRFVNIYKQPERRPDQLYALMTTERHRAPRSATHRY